ncbi:MAG: hypothetical protein KGI08_08330 [Thaumarchaeota archaeon]|nr:hypothetical protein [Nitrososphaerota archaeon]
MYSATKTLNLGKLCRSIINSSNSIQSVEIISKSGLTLERLGSDKTINPNKEENRRSLGKCLFDISLGEKLDDLYGPIQYHFSEGNFAMFSFPLNENCVVVTTMKNISPISLATKIAQIIIKFGSSEHRK